MGVRSVSAVVLLRVRIWVCVGGLCVEARVFSGGRWLGVAPAIGVYVDSESSRENYVASAIIEALEYTSLPAVVPEFFRGPSRGTAWLMVKESFVSRFIMMPTDLL